MNILVSACLLGQICRYDAKKVECQDVLALQQKHHLIPVCPEVFGGLSTPRDPAERIETRVMTCHGADVTKEYEAGARKALALAKEHGCTLAILKERSPSCGHGTIYDGTFSGTLTAGNGVAADLLNKNGVTVIGESQIAAYIANGKL